MYGWVEVFRSTQWEWPPKAIHQTLSTLLQSILSPAVPYYTVTLDFVLGLPRLPNGNNCVLTVTDKYTKQIGLISVGTGSRQEITWRQISANQSSHLFYSR